MSDYQLTDTDLVIRTRDSANIPNDPDNRDRAEYEAWLAAGGVPDPYVPPPVDLVAYAANMRWQKEVGGITVAGVPVATDDRSKLMITGARVAAAADPGWTTTWIGSDGNAYPLNVAAMVAISNAVADHVNACFATYATVAAEIAVGTITTAAEIDAVFG